MAINIKERFSASTVSGTCLLGDYGSRRSPSGECSLPTMVGGLSVSGVGRLGADDLVLHAGELGDAKVLEPGSGFFYDLQERLLHIQPQDKSVGSRLMVRWLDDLDHVSPLWDANVCDLDEIVSVGEGVEPAGTFVFRTASTHCYVGLYSEDPDRKFNRLAEEWRSETAFLSSVTDMAMHPAYQEIIGMGTDAVPLILAELEHAPDHWFWALKAITGANPVPAEAKGRVEEMARAWLRWGRMHGYRY